MENNVLHPSKSVWVKVVFDDELTLEQKDERQMKIWQRLRSDMRPILGISEYHTEARERIHPSSVDFIVVNCRRPEEGVEHGSIEVLMQYWDDVEDHPDLTTGDVIFVFLTDGDELRGVNYATLRPRGLINLTTTW